MKKFLKPFLLTFFFLTLFLTFSSTALAANFTPLDFKPQIKIPDSDFGSNSTPVGSYLSSSGEMSSTLLARYIKVIYDYGMKIVGILAAVVLMAGGLIWLTSGGDSGKIGQAKELISGSLIGMIVLFSSWIILNTVNPALLTLKPIITPVSKPINTKKKSSLKCEWKCVSMGNKCEGGGGNDTLPSYSVWKTLPEKTCNDEIGLAPTKCPNVTDIPNCCCQGNYDASSTPVNDVERAQIIACMTNSGGNKPDYSSCSVGSAKGYCKEQPKVNGERLARSLCTTCLDHGATCRNNVGSGDYECANSKGLCGSSNSGDCNASLVDGNWAQAIVTWVSASTVACNKINCLPIGCWAGEFNVECKCK